MPPRLSDLPVGTRVFAKWYVAPESTAEQPQWTRVVGRVTRVEPDPGGDPDLDYLWVLPEDGGDEVRIKPRLVSEILASECSVCHKPITRPNTPVSLDRYLRTKAVRCLDCLLAGLVLTPNGDQRSKDK